MTYPGHEWIPSNPLFVCKTTAVVDTGHQNSHPQHVAPTFQLCWVTDHLRAMVARQIHVPDYGLLHADELVMMLQSQDMQLAQIQGMSLSLARRDWTLTGDLGVNYIAAFSRT